MAKDLPRITVVTPSFNQGQFLEQTIRSVVEQGYPNLEYIVMDGGSTDNSVEIIKKYENKITYWQSQKDKGQSDAIARGFAMASGDILGWINSDDFLLAGAIGKVGAKFNQNKDLVLLCGILARVDEQNKPFAVLLPERHSYRGMAFWGTGSGQPAMFWSKKAYQSAGGMDISSHFSFDYDLILRLRKFGQMDIISEYLAAFRTQQDQKTMTFIDEMLKENNEVVMHHGGFGKMGLKLRQFAHKYNLKRKISNRYYYYKDSKKLRELSIFGTDEYRDPKTGQDK